MKYGERDGSGRFAKKAIEVRDTDTGTTDTTEEQEQGQGQEQDNVTVLYCDSIEGVGAVVDKVLVPLGIAGVGTEVDEALALLGINIVGNEGERVSEPVTV